MWTFGPKKAFSAVWNGTSRPITSVNPRGFFFLKKKQCVGTKHGRFLDHFLAVDGRIVRKQETMF